MFLNPAQFDTHSVASPNIEAPPSVVTTLRRPRR